MTYTWGKMRKSQPQHTSTVCFIQKEYMRYVVPYTYVIGDGGATFNFEFCLTSLLVVAIDLHGTKSFEWLRENEL